MSGMRADDLAVAGGELVEIAPGAQVAWATPNGSQAGTVVHTYDRDGDDVLVAVTRSMRWGKPHARLVHVLASEVDAESVVPATAQQRQAVARWVCAALGAKRGAFNGYELSLLGYAAAMAGLAAEHRARRDAATWSEPAKPAASLWE